MPTGGVGMNIQKGQLSLPPAASGRFAVEAALTHLGGWEFRQPAVEYGGELFGHLPGGVPRVHAETRDHPGSPGLGCHARPVLEVLGAQVPSPAMGFVGMVIKGRRGGMMLRHLW